METNKLTVGIFIPCCVDQFSTHTGKNMVKLLQEAGFACVYPHRQTCCGLDLFFNGDQEGAKILGKQIMEQFHPYPRVVTCGSGCAAYMKHFFGDLFYNSSLHNESRKFTEKLYDFSHFLSSYCDQKKLSDMLSTHIFPHRVAFLEHHRTAFDYGTRQEPRLLLQSVTGLELVEMSEPCCDLGGTFANFFEPIASELIRQKVDEAQQLGAEYIVTTDPALALHIQSYIDHHKMAFQCLHICDLLANSK